GDYLCASCIDYLIAYHPLWLNPALLPRPSPLDVVARRESPLISSDLSMIEWESPRGEPSTGDAVQLIRLLGLEGPIAPTLSVGDADLLHRVLRDTRRSTPTNPEERDALSQVYHYMAGCAWMPSHLAWEYRLQADTLPPGAADTAEAAEGPLGGRGAPHERAPPGRTRTGPRVERERGGGPIQGSHGQSGRPRKGCGPPGRPTFSRNGSGYVRGPGRRDRIRLSRHGRPRIRGREGAYAMPGSDGRPRPGDSVRARPRGGRRGAGRDPPAGRGPCFPGRRRLRSRPRLL